MFTFAAENSKTCEAVRARTKNKDKERESRYRKIFEEYYPELLVMARGRANDDAEDILQNVFIKYYEKMNEVRDAKSWLYGSVRLELKNYIRKNAKTVNVENIEVYEDIYQDDAFNDLRFTLDSIIDSVPIKETDRALFEMLALRGFSFKEAAEECGYTVRQARYHYSSVKKEIRDALKRRGISKVDDLL